MYDDHETYGVEPICFELIDHGQVFGEVLVIVHIEALRDEWNKWSTRAVCRPHPERTSTQVSLGDRGGGVGEIQERRASLELLGLGGRSGRVCSRTADIVCGLLGCELADINGDLYAGGIERDRGGGPDGADFDGDIEASQVGRRTRARRKYDGLSTGDRIVNDGGIDYKRCVLCILFEIWAEDRGTAERHERIFTGQR